MLATDVYDLILTLPIRNYQTSAADLPLNGIYIYFEDGEQCEVGGRLVPRIVRIGTHRVDGRFPSRIRSHHGSARKLGGNKNSSVFRQHLGGAFLRRDNPTDSRLPEWTQHGGATFPEVEATVSQYLRDRMTYVCFQVDRADERLSLESGLIALLSQHPLGEPSVPWLGKHAPNRDIAWSGLWNTQHVRDIPLSSQQFRRIVELIGDMNRTVVTDAHGGDQEAVQPDEVGQQIAEPEPRCDPRTMSKDREEQRTLVIVPCGSAKVWDGKPATGPVAARDVYTGPPFVVNRQYAERFGDDWVILSAKYGFIDPDFVIPEPYNVSFKFKRTNPVGVETLRSQISEQKLDQYDRIIALGGKDYAAPIERAFVEKDTETFFPFLGLPIGRMMSATRRAISTGCPLPSQETDRTP